MNDRDIALVTLFMCQVRLVASLLLAHAKTAFLLWEAQFHRKYSSTAPLNKMKKIWSEIFLLLLPSTIFFLRCLAWLPSCPKTFPGHAVFFLFLFSTPLGRRRQRFCGGSACNLSLLFFGLALATQAFYSLRIVSFFYLGPLTSMPNSSVTYTRKQKRHTTADNVPTLLIYSIESGIASKYFRMHRNISINFQFLQS